MIRLEDEILKEIPGFSNYYISNHGNVWTTKFSTRLNPTGGLKKLNLWMDHPSGYVNAGIYSAPGMKNRKYFRVHKLVYETFYETEIPKGYVIDHIDGNKKNNRLDNLQILTLSQNIQKYHSLEKIDKNKN